MRYRFFAIVPLLALAGCYTYAPLEVKLFDAVTKQPISGVRVQADYRRFIEFFPPKLDSAVTGKDGIAYLDVCTNYAKGGNIARLSFIDSGYLLDEDMPRALLEVDTKTFHAGMESPRQVDIAVVTVAQHRRRYP